jgi:hypothetical protein
VFGIYAVSILLFPSPRLRLGIVLHAPPPAVRGPDRRVLLGLILLLRDPGVEAILRTIIR